MPDNDALGNITSIASLSMERQQRRLDRLFMQTAAAKLLPKERVASCLRYKAPQYDTVNVVYDHNGKRARYKHLMLCTSVWSCPICASNISEGRRTELEKALSKTSLVPYLITYTLSHRIGNSLQFSLWRIKRAYDLMKSGKQWKALSHDIGWSGSVRALEITYGRNGWHPHIHELAFLDEQPLVTIEDTRKELAARWQDKVEKAGGTTSLGHGFDLRKSWKDVQEYIAKFGHDPDGEKWDFSSEVTRAASKIAAQNGTTPFGLLWAYANGNLEAGSLFVEYALTMKGSNQLIWSRGLRERLGMLEPEPKDAELADQPLTETERVMLKLDNDAWHEVRKQGKRAELLEICELDDAPALAEYLEGLGLEIFEDTVTPRLPF